MDAIYILTIIITIVLLALSIFSQILFTRYVAVTHSNHPYFKGCFATLQR